MTEEKVEMDLQVAFDEFLEAIADHRFRIEALETEVKDLEEDLMDRQNKHATAVGLNSQSIMGLLPYGRQGHCCRFGQSCCVMYGLPRF